MSLHRLIITVICILRPCRVVSPVGTGGREWREKRAGEGQMGYRYKLNSKDTKWLVCRECQRRLFRSMPALKQTWPLSLWDGSCLPSSSTWEEGGQVLEKGFKVLHSSLALLQRSHFPEDPAGLKIHFAFNIAQYILGWRGIRGGETQAECCLLVIKASRMHTAPRAVVEGVCLGRDAPSPVSGCPPLWTSGCTSASQGLLGDFLPGSSSSCS